MTDKEFINRWAKLSLIIEDKHPELKDEFSALSLYTTKKIGQCQAYVSVVEALLNDPVVKERIEHASRYLEAKRTVDTLFKGMF